MTLDKKISILWIDDDKERYEDAVFFQKKIKSLQIKFIHPNMIEKTLEKEKGFDLFLLDFFLNQKKDTKGIIFNHRGFTCAGQIRERFSEHPIYGISEKDIDKDGIFRNESYAANNIFDKTFEYRDIQRNGHIVLYHDSLAYRKLRHIPKNNLGKLIETITAPNEVIDDIKLIIPTDLRSGLSGYRDGSNPNSNPLSFVRWIRNEFLNTPGYLYNELYCSVHLGMSIPCFKKNINKIKAALYHGIFSETNEPLWWVSSINNIIFSSVYGKKNPSYDVKQIAIKQFKVGKKDQSKCAKCDDLLPDTVGVNLDDIDDVKPIHYKCSIPHPNIKRNQYFDDPRAFKL